MVAVNSNIKGAHNHTVKTPNVVKAPTVAANDTNRVDFADFFNQSMNNQSVKNTAQNQTINNSNKPDKKSDNIDNQADQSAYIAGQTAQDNNASLNNDTNIINSEDITDKLINADDQSLDVENVNINAIELTETNNIGSQTDQNIQNSQNIIAPDAQINNGINGEATQDAELAIAGSNVKPDGKNIATNLHAQLQNSGSNKKPDVNENIANDGDIASSNDELKTTEFDAGSNKTDAKSQFHLSDKDNANFARLIENNNAKANEKLSAEVINTDNNSSGDTNVSETSTNTGTSPTAQTNNIRINLDNIQSLAAIMVRKHINGERSFTIRLDPPELGQIKVELKVAADKKVHAVIMASNQDALNDLTKSAKELAQAVQDSGFDLNEEDMEFSLQSQFSDGFNSPSQQNYADELNAKTNRNLKIANNDETQGLKDISNNPILQRHIWQNSRVSIIA